MPKRIVKKSSGNNSKTHLKVAAVINTVTRLVPRYKRKARQTGIAAFIPNRLQVGNSLIIELTFPRSGQTFAVQGRVSAIEHCEDSSPDLSQSCIVSV